MSIVARRYDVNANQLSLWRRELMPQAAVVESEALLPVEIAVEEPSRPRRSDRGSCIEIEFISGVRVRVRGQVASAVLRQVIELLQ